MSLPRTSRAILFKKWPVGLPNVDTDFEASSVSLPALADGEVLLKTLFLSVDPYMRGRMTNRKSYVPPFEIGKPLVGGGVGEVIASKNSSVKQGDVLAGSIPWQDFAVVSAGDLKGFEKFDKSTGLSPSTAIGVLGMPGMTAYFGLLDICNPKPGETVVVSGAGGAVGMLVGQIAKIKGCHVVGISGSDEKNKLLRTFGFDAVINYKTTKSLDKDLMDACPKGVDVYFDNVGGTISDAVMLRTNTFARVSVCGAISSYNDSGAVPTGPRDNFLLISRQIKKEGFIVSRWYTKWPAAKSEMAKWINEGKLKHVETLRNGLENTPKAFVELLSGDNTGKMIVQVGQPSQAAKL